MLLSIIIAVKNDAEMLERILMQIEEQTFKDYELIVVDGGSSDDSVDVAVKHGAAVIVSKDQSEGRHMVSHAADKNLASQDAFGEYLLHIDADMRFSDTIQLERIMRFCVDNGVVAATTKITGYDGGPREMYRRIWDPILTQVIFVRRKEFLELGGFPFAHILDVGLHNRYIVAGYRPVLLDEEFEHLRQYNPEGLFPRDWDFLPSRVNFEGFIKDKKF